MDNLILIGSQALKYYGRLAGRKPADYDFITTKESSISKVDNKVIELHSVDDSKTNKEIYEYCIKYSKARMQTPVGEAIVAPLEILKVLKLSCMNHLDKAKHYWDLANLEDISLSKEMIQLSARREEEIYKRIQNDKKSFFNKHPIQRFMDHDELHTYVNKTPTYLKALTSATGIDENKFLRLTVKERVSIIREECLVLALERDLIPKCRKVPFLVKFFTKRFLNTTTSSSPAQKWLSRLSTPGKLDDNPVWLSTWARNNYELIIADFDKWWQIRVNALPVKFWERILQ